MLKKIQFKYMNHRGEVSIRTIVPDAIEFYANSHYGHQPGWFISGFDDAKKQRRSFALSRIVFGDDTLKHKFFRLELGINVI